MNHCLMANWNDWQQRDTRTDYLQQKHCLTKSIANECIRCALAFESAYPMADLRNTGSCIVLVGLKPLLVSNARLTALFAIV